MSFFEAFMLICFGVSWPIAIAKTVRAEAVDGKSPLFLAIVCLGYLSGIMHKALVSYDWVIVLYILNLAMVATDLALYYYYTARRQ
ncbi:MAG: hypothetical protein U1E05_20510 [Patescibacteria group bacterium]|nr:hypothetical protein [Patescibacteria group bacterium]